MKALITKGDKKMVQGALNELKEMRDEAKFSARTELGSCHVMNKKNMRWVKAKLLSFNELINVAEMQV